MRSATFDVPATLEQYLYSWLESGGWHPRVSTAKAEWDREGSFEYIRLIHVGGEVEIHYRPHGKRVEVGAQMWRRARDVGDQVQFIEWLARIKAAIEDQEVILAKA